MTKVTHAVRHLESFQLFTIVYSILRLSLSLSLSPSPYKPYRVYTREKFPSQSRNDTARTFNRHKHAILQGHWALRIPSTPSVVALSPETRKTLTTLTSRCYRASFSLRPRFFRVSEWFRESRVELVELEWVELVPDYIAPITPDYSVLGIARPLGGGAT